MARQGNYRSAARIELAGGIASGKTTLARLLMGGSLRCVLERFRANPFAKAFYSDPARYSFETEITFLLQHYHAIKTLTKQGRTLVCDFSMVLDRAYAELNLRGRQVGSFLGVYNQVVREVKYPCLLVHLRCDPSTELERIRERGRQEELSISVDYLAELNHAAEKRAAKFSKHVRVITIDSAERNFARNDAVRVEVRAQVLAALDS